MANIIGVPLHEVSGFSLNKDGVIDEIIFKAEKMKDDFKKGNECHQRSQSVRPMDLRFPYFSEIPEWDQLTESEKQFMSPNYDNITTKTLKQTKDMKKVNIGDLVKVKKEVDISSLHNFDLSHKSEYEIENIAIVMGQDKQIIQILDDNNDMVWLGIHSFNLCENKKSKAEKATDTMSIQPERMELDNYDGSLYAVFKTVTDEKVKINFNKDMKIIQVNSEW